MKECVSTQAFLTLNLVYQTNKNSKNAPRNRAHAFIEQLVQLHKVFTPHSPYIPAE